MVAIHYQNFQCVLEHCNNVVRTRVQVKSTDKEIIMRKDNYVFHPCGDLFLLQC